jgi:putative photosynthetic complex assembly protein 2
MGAGWTAALLALFVWWFATGVILLAVRLADRRGPSAHRALALGTLPLFVLGLWGFAATLTMEGLLAVHLAFASVILIWGWVELAFLTGTVTGPVRQPCPGGVPEWERFIRAWGTIAYHEMLLAGLLLAMLITGWGAENPFGMYLFAVLFAARVSAKLNLFFGVPKINVEFLPSALSHLPSHFRIARFNWLYPLSVTALAFATAFWAERLIAAETPAATAGFALLAAMTALALLEHWFMVLPLPDEKLWRWMLPAPGRHQDQGR